MLRTASRSFDSVQCLLRPWADARHNNFPFRVLTRSCCSGIVASHLQHRVPRHLFALGMDPDLRIRLVEEISLTRGPIIDPRALDIQKRLAFHIKLLQNSLFLPPLTPLSHPLPPPSPYEGFCFIEGTFSPNKLYARVPQEPLRSPVFPPRPPYLFSRVSREQSTTDPADYGCCTADQPGPGSIFSENRTSSGPYLSSRFFEQKCPG